MGIVRAHHSTGDIAMTKTNSLWHWAAKSRDEKIFSFQGCFRDMIFWPRWTAKLHLTQRQLELHCQGHGNHLHKEGGVGKIDPQKRVIWETEVWIRTQKRWRWSSQRSWGGRLRVLSEFSQGREAKTKVMNDFFPKALAKGSFEKHSPHCQIKTKYVKGDGWWLMAPWSKTAAHLFREVLNVSHNMHNAHCAYRDSNWLWHTVWPWTWIEKRHDTPRLPPTRFNSVPTSVAAHSPSRPC